MKDSISNQYGLCQFVAKKNFKEGSFINHNLPASNFTALLRPKSQKSSPFPCCGKKCLPKSPSGRVEIQFQTCISIKENGINFPSHSAVFPLTPQLVRWVPLFHRALERKRKFMEISAVFHVLAEWQFPFGFQKPA